MLVITRRIGEEIVINDQIRVRACAGVGGTRVQLAVTAPNRSAFIVGKFIYSAVSSKANTRRKCQTWRFPFPQRTNHAYLHHLVS